MNQRGGRSDEEEEELLLPSWSGLQSLKEQTHDTFLSVYGLINVAERPQDERL